MRTQGVSTGGVAPPPVAPAIGDKGAKPHAERGEESGVARALSEAVPPAGRAPAPDMGDVALADVWNLLALCLPYRAHPLDSLPDIVVPAGIAGDSRQRMAYRMGVLAARELDVGLAGLGTEDLVALGREAIADQVLSGTVSDVLCVLARLEGKVDDAAWMSRDADRIAGQVDAFLRTGFQDEIALYQALQGLASEPPLPGRRQLADALLHAQDIDPHALLDTSYRAATENISASSPPLLRDRTAGAFYFEADRLDAAAIRRMKTRAGRSPGPAHVERVRAALPASLHAEFGRRFDEHQTRMSTHLAQWLSARVALHARQHGIDPDTAAVTVSRARMRFFTRLMGMRAGDAAKFSDAYGTAVSRGYVVSLQTADRLHRCFVSFQTGEVQGVPERESIESWLKREHERVFHDGAARARLAAQPGRWLPRLGMEQLASGPYASLRPRMTEVFRDEIARGRDAARGQTWSEGAVDTLLDLIPFRAMVVSLSKGDIATALLHGSFDVLSLLPLVGTGARLAGTAARSAVPWLRLGVRFGDAAGSIAAASLRRAAGRVPLVGERIKSTVKGAAIRQLGRLRPMDVQRMAQRLRATAPRLADVLERIAARSRAPVIPDGVWRIQAVSRTAPETMDTIRALSPVPARSLGGGKLRLLPYGERTGAYTQVDAAGQRVGALLLADSEGWLHQAMPIASLQRYRVGLPELVHALQGSRIREDGTVVLAGSHYARLGSDYVQVTRDAAASTPERAIWRAVAPEGVMPDVVAHCLVYDRSQGLWRQAEAPRLAGGGLTLGRVRALGGTRIAAAPLPGTRVTPGEAQLARFRDELCASVRGATPQQADALRALLDRIAGDRRGKAILNAFSAHYDLLGGAPRIVLGAGAAAAAPRPSLDRPAPGDVWHLDLEALRFGTTEAAVDELAAVYNNMTGLLHNDDPFDAMLARGEPSLDPGLEQAWSEWMAQDPQAGGNLDARATDAALTPRELTVLYLQARIREMRCYGGLDRSTLKAVLRNQRGRWEMKLNLSHRGIDSIPPLPRDTAVLNVSSNPIRDWTRLPARLTVLDAEATGLSELPPNLPRGLLELNVSGNRLGRATLAFPPGLVRLGLGNNGLTEVPPLPRGLTELVLRENGLEALPAGLPRGLELLDASNNALTRLPDDLPSTLRVLHAEHNRLQQLPVLPDGLDELAVSWNRLQSLGELPRSLRILEAGHNALDDLPANLPSRLEMLIVPRNRLRRLPDGLPTSLTLVSVQHNAIEDLPANVAALRSCTIHLDGNPLAPGAIPVIAIGGAGPRIFFDDGMGVASQRARTVGRSVRYWWSRPAVDAQSRWDAIDRTLGRRADALEFAVFLDRLRTTVSYRDPAFRAQVEEWLEEISRPERQALLRETLAVCQGGTETCEDRLISTWNDTQNLRRNDDVRAGLFDDRVPEVIDTARQMFRLEVLTAIARAQERSRVVIDPIELYLAYAVRLRDPLGLATVAPMMRFYDLSFVTAHDLLKARETVQARERAEFAQFLVLDYEPWQSLLKRKDAAAYAAAEQEARRLLETTFEPRLREEMEKLGLDPADEGLRQDARTNLGPGIMREIRYRALSPLSRGYLSPREQP
ncbi:NEL-type E3 ubiquitin ligase domain-containing protein [Bordetella bronchialis]